MATPFQAYRGEHQQRIATEHASAGAFAYEMGHAAHLDVNLNVGDRHDVAQTFQLPAEAALIRPRVRIATPATLPSGMQWEFQVLLNGTQHYRRRLTTASRLVVLTDIAVRLAAAVIPPASNTLTFRLRLV